MVKKDRMISGINWEDQQNKENGGSFVITRAYPNSKKLELGFERVEMMQMRAFPLTNT